MAGLLALVVAIAVLGGRGPLSFTGLNAVPQQYRPWITKAGSQCSQITSAVIAAQLYQESGFNPAAVSPTGARGIAQFEPESFARSGRDETGRGVASPDDPADAIMAQGRYMCALARQAQHSGLPGDPVALALAGYNAGWGAVEKYRGIPPYPETRHYVRCILALAQHKSGATHPRTSAFRVGSGSS